MPRIFSYPISGHPLILMAAMAVFGMLFSGPGLINALLKGLMWLLVIKYSFESLKATASGNLKAPPINGKTISDDFGKVFKQGGIYAAIFILFGVLSAKVGILVGLVFLVTALFFVPSMIILLVTSGSLMHALNPVVFVGLSVRIGWAYFLMNFFLILLGSAPAYLAQYIIRFLPPDLQILLFGFAKSFYTIISYHLMGYVILQYHEKIGYHVDYEDFQDPGAVQYESAEADPDAAVLREVAPLIQDGRLDEAIDVIKKYTEQQPIHGMELSERYYNLLKMRNRNSELLLYGIKHLDVLTGQNQKNKALAVFSECRKLDGEFLPAADSLLKLAGWLNETGKTKAAIAAYNLIVKSYPDSPLLPKAYFRIAQIFHDRLMSADKAKKVLSAIKKKYPDHEIMPHVDNFLARL